MKKLFPKPGYYRVKIISNASVTEYRGQMDDGTIKIAVNQPREKGKANKELIEFLAEQLDMRKDQIGISSGLTSPIKVIHIEN